MSGRQAMVSPRDSRVAVCRQPKFLIPEATPRGRAKPEPFTRARSKEDPLLGLLVPGTGGFLCRHHAIPVLPEQRRGWDQILSNKDIKCLGCKPKPAMGANNLNTHTHTDILWQVSLSLPHLVQRGKRGQGAVTQGPHPVSRNR